MIESDHEDEFTRAFRQMDGLPFVGTSSPKIDRVLTIFRATKLAKRLLLIGQ